jgi:hypothetical protein
MTVLHTERIRIKNIDDKAVCPYPIIICEESVVQSYQRWWLRITCFDIDAGRVDENNFGSKHLALLLRPNDSDFCVGLEFFVAKGVPKASN